MERAVVFVDGNNWYHALKRAGCISLGWLNYAKVSAKLIGARDWIGTRYYIGQVQQTPQTATLYADQRRYTSWLAVRDKRVSIHFGRLETHTAENDFALEVKRYLAALTVRIDPVVYRHLVEGATRHAKAMVVVEKAVDVALAVDMVRMADTTSTTPPICWLLMATIPLRSRLSWPPARKSLPLPWSQARSLPRSYTSSSRSRRNG